METDEHEIERSIRRTIPESALPAPISHISVTPLLAIHSIDSLHLTTPVTCATSKLRISSAEATASAFTLETRGISGSATEVFESASRI